MLTSISILSFYKDFFGKIIVFSNQIGFNNEKLISSLNKNKATFFAAILRNLSFKITATWNIVGFSIGEYFLGNISQNLLCGNSVLHKVQVSNFHCPLTTAWACLT